MSATPKQLATGFLLGVAVGLLLTHRPPAVPVVETAAPAVKQADGSLVLARKPVVTPEPRTATPARAVVERTASVRVKPKPIGETPQVGLPCDCNPIDIDLTLVRERDGGRRMIVKSDSGDILGGVDNPVVVVDGPVDRRWSISALRSTHGVSGGLVQYEHGALTVGVGMVGQTGFVSAGVKF